MTRRRSGSSPGPTRRPLACSTSTVAPAAYASRDEPPVVLGRAREVASLRRACARSRSTGRGSSVEQARDRDRRRRRGRGASRSPSRSPARARRAGARRRGRAARATRRRPESERFFRSKQKPPSLSGPGVPSLPSLVSPRPNDSAGRTPPYRVSSRHHHDRASESFMRAGFPASDRPKSIRRRRSRGTAPASERPSARRPGGRRGSCTRAAGSDAGLATRRRSLPVKRDLDSAVRRTGELQRSARAHGRVDVGGVVLEGRRPLARRESRRCARRSSSIFARQLPLDLESSPRRSSTSRRLGIAMSGQGLLDGSGKKLFQLKSASARGNASDPRPRRARRISRCRRGARPGATWRSASGAALRAMNARITKSVGSSSKVSRARAARARRGELQPIDPRGIRRLADLPQHRRPPHHDTATAISCQTMVGRRAPWSRSADQEASRNREVGFGSPCRRGPRRVPRRAGVDAAGARAVRSCADARLARLALRQVHRPARRALREQDRADWPSSGSAGSRESTTQTRRRRRRSSRPRRRAATCSDRCWRPKLESARRGLSLRGGAAAGPADRPARGRCRAERRAARAGAPRRWPSSPAGARDDFRSMARWSCSAPAVRLSREARPSRGKATGPDCRGCTPGSRPLPARAGGPSSSTMPRAARSLRIRSASAKSRRLRAALRAAICASISAGRTSAAAGRMPRTRSAAASAAFACARAGRVERALVDRGVDLAQEREERAERLGGVQVVVHRRGELLAQPAPRARPPGIRPSVFPDAAALVEARGRRADARRPPPPRPASPSHVKFSFLRYGTERKR